MTPIKYVPKKINGVLMWVPVYKKGEGPSLSQKVGVPCGYLKKYEKDHRGVKDGVQVRAVCRICEKPFKYTKSKASRPRILCSAVCAYQAQKNSTKEYTARKKVAAVKGVEKPTERKVVQNTEKTTICKGCGKVFYWKQEGRHPPRKFCEEQCRLNYWIKNQAATRRTDRGVEYICKNCDKAFLHTSNQEPFQKYCTNKCRMSYNNRIESKTFVERVAEHLPPTSPPPDMKEKIAPTRPVPQPPSWEILVEEASNMGIDLDKEPPRAQNFFVSLLMARRAHHFDEWKKLLKSQNVRIRQLPETYMALKSVSGEGAIGAARALKTRMGM
jgi:hypothetical protein